MLHATYVSGAVQAVRFLLVADREPGLLPRLLQPFAKRDLVPDRMSAVRHGDALHVELALDAMPAQYVHLVEGNLWQVVGVQSVARHVEAPIAIAA